MSMMPPPALVEAIEKLWQSAPAVTESENLFAIPEFGYLRKTCHSLYPASGSTEMMMFPLSQALSALGFRRSGEPTRFPLSPANAATRIDAAFRQTLSKRIHLCPLDCAGDIPQLQFGPNRIRTFTADEFDELVDPDGIARSTGSHFESSRFAGFSWLVVEEHVPLPMVNGVRALPPLLLPAQRFGEIEPHRSRYPDAVQTALFMLLTIPWEEVVHDSKFEWRPFRIPWVYTLSNDLFSKRTTYPRSETLTWEPMFYENKAGQLIDYEQPFRLHLKKDANAAASIIDDTAWAVLVEVLRSDLTAKTVLHFFVSAFANDAIDEFLAHLITIEAALGSPDDYRQGGSRRVARRVAGLLNKAEAGELYRSLFSVRSTFIHGQEMGAIRSTERIEARRLARRCMQNLIRAVSAASPLIVRADFLEGLLNNGRRLM